MSNVLLLQVGADTVQQIINTPKVQVEELSLWFLLKEGGPLMIPLLICSILAVYVFFERFMAIKKAGTVPENFMQAVKDNLLEGNVSKALSYTKNYTSSVPKVIYKGISRIGKPLDHIEKSMENEGKLEVYKMEKKLNILSIIAGIAPMFGFLGTIAGMIILFFNIQTHGFEIKNIAGGIYTKMVTSAVGLIIGLLSYVAYNVLQSLIDKNINKIERASNELLDTLHEPIK